MVTNIVLLNHFTASNCLYWGYELPLVSMNCLPEAMNLFRKLFKELLHNIPRYFRKPLLIGKLINFRYLNCPKTLVILLYSLLRTKILRALTHFPFLNVTFALCNFPYFFPNFIGFWNIKYALSLRNSKYAFSLRNSRFPSKFASSYFSPLKPNRNRIKIILWMLRREVELLRITWNVFCMFHERYHNCSPCLMFTIS